MNYFPFVIIDVLCL